MFLFRLWFPNSGSGARFRNRVVRCDSHLMEIGATEGLVTALVFCVAHSYGTRPTGTRDRSMVCLCSGRHFFHLTKRPRPGNTRTQTTGTGPHRCSGGHESHATTAFRTWSTIWLFLSILKELARRLVARRGADWKPCGGQLVGRCKIIVEFLPGSGSLGCSFHLSVSKVGCFRIPHVAWVLCKLLDVEEGCSEMEDDHCSSCWETWYQGHELFGLERCRHSWMEESHRKHFYNPTLWEEVRTSLYDNTRLEDWHESRRPAQRRCSPRRRPAGAQCWRKARGCQSSQNRTSTHSWTAARSSTMLREHSIC